MGHVVCIKLNPEKMYSIICYLRILREEEEKGGLVIVAALYGLLVSNKYNIIKNISSSTSHQKNTGL